MKCAVILLCAGRGRRLKRSRDKAFIQLKSQPLFLYSYRVFKKTPHIHQIIIVARKKYFSYIRRNIKDVSVIIVQGGKRRQDSVCQGLKRLNNDIDRVIVHDAARPLITQSLTKALIQSLRTHKAVIFALQVTDALKQVSGTLIEKSIKRDALYSVQTPQGFDRRVIERAYKRYGKISVHDDSALVERLGVKVKVLEGIRDNIKVTYRGDLAIAACLLAKRKKRK